MFKELVLSIHSAGHKLLVRPATVPRGSGCRALVKNSFWANAVLFIAIFTPLYICLLKDLVDMVRNYKIRK